MKTQDKFFHYLPKKVQRELLLRRSIEEFINTPTTPKKEVVTSNDDPTNIKWHQIKEGDIFTLDVRNKSLKRWHKVSKVTRKQFVNRYTGKIDNRKEQV